MLAVTEVRGGSERLVFTHGFTQNAAFWETQAAHYPAWHVLAPDLPGHGGSSHYAAADLKQSAELLGDVGGVADYIGYSLGGRISLHLALARPESVRSLVLIGARPGLADPTAREDRLRRDDDMAARIEAMDADELGAWLRREWLTLDLFRSLPASAAHVELRTRNDPPALAMSLRQTGLGRQDYLLPYLNRLTMPVLLLHGDHDRPEIVREIQEMAEAIGSNARVVSVPGAGHSVPFEQPIAFTEELSSFLAER